MVCGTDLGMESSADCRELDTVCSAVVGDSLGGPSFSTVVVEYSQGVQRKLVRPLEDGFQLNHQTVEQTVFPILCG